jgi:hypothetical protein
MHQEPDRFPTLSLTDQLASGSVAGACNGLRVEGPDAGSLVRGGTLMLEERRHAGDRA